MNSLRKKLAFSYGLLIVILLAVSVWSIYHLAHLGRAIDMILVKNYKSILASENMKEALERMDSSAMFFVASHTDKARQQFAEKATKFSQELQIISGNITEPGEDQIIADIDSQYSSYKQQVEQFLSAPESLSSVEQSNIYFKQLEPAFVALRARLDDALRINQQAMLAANDRATAESWEAEISMAGVAAAALGIALLFAWRFTRYVVDPISSLTDKAKRIGEGDFEQFIDIQSQDEIGALAAEFNRMTARLRDLRKSDYWRLLLEQKKSDAVINSIYEPVIVTDARGRVLKVNAAAQRLFESFRKGSKADGDITLSGFSAGERIIRAVEDAVRMQQPVASEDEAALVPIKVGGAERSYRLRTTLMRDEDGRLIGAVTVLEDITDIREVDRLKTEFISVASGKLGEPLHSLQLALHALVEGYMGEFTEQQMDMLISARQAAEQLEDMMSDLLELAEIESGARNISTERLRPIDIARSAIERFQSDAESKRIRLESSVWPDLPWVIADRRAMKSIFDNLLSNAIRHTPRDGTVKIEATERGGRIYFCVRDTGEGIPEEYLPNLFGRFVKIEGRPGGGTGLGLALVKRLVEAQGGQISVESRVGEGATFAFMLLAGGPASVRA
jgi:two-component system, NtrC family, sensor histidine kinase KinB